MDGPLAGQADLASRQLDLLTDAGGEVLVMAATIVPERSRHPGRAEHADTPRLTDSGWSRLIDLVTTIGTEAQQRGVTPAFHPHTGTFVETPAEAARLARELKGTPGLLAALAAARYSGWLMVEQDTSWGPPSEATAMAQRVRAFALAHQR